MLLKSSRSIGDDVVSTVFSRELLSSRSITSACAFMSAIGGEQGETRMLEMSCGVGKCEIRK